MHLSRKPSRGAGWVVTVVAILLVFAPVLRGGNRPLPLMALELSALLLLAGFLLAGLPARARAWFRVSPALLAGLGALVLLPLMQLVPLPPGFVEAGREAYAAAIGELGIDGGRTTLSVVPLLTEAAGIALLPPLVVFLVVMSLRGVDVEHLVLVFLGMACVQAVLGLVQYGAGGEALAALGIGYGSGSGEGTYTNRNHLAGLLEMALPIALALLAASVFRLDRATVAHGRRPSLWKRVKSLGASEGTTNRSFLYGAICLVILLGLVFTRSRTGVALGIVGLILTTVLLMRNFGGRFSAHLASVIAGVGLVLAATVGLAPVLARFSQDPLADGRWAIFEASWQAVKDFFPFGSGAGTYVEVIGAYHPEAFRGEAYINRAHNDYLEWLVEGGVVALVVMLLFAAAYLMRWPAVWRVRNWQTLHMMQVGAGVGLLLLMLHGLTDYNLRIPANQIYFALLAAVFFHRETNGAGRAKHGRRATDGVGDRVADDSASPHAAVSSAPGGSRLASTHSTASNPHRARPAGAQAASDAWASAPDASSHAGKKIGPELAPPLAAVKPEARRNNPFADNG